MIECECRVELAGYRIIHCPKHAAVDDLLKALSAILKLADTDPDIYYIPFVEREDAEAAIARATKESE